MALQRLPIEERISKQKKHCCDCERLLDFSEFYKFKRSPDGKGYKCKACVKTENKRRMSNPANRKKRSQAYRKWVKNNRDKFNAMHRHYNHVQDARDRGLHHQLTLEQWDWLVEKTGNRCVYCGAHESETGTLERDHIVPLSRGGKYTLSNIRPACRPCNLKKGARTPSEADMRFVIEINTLEYMKQLNLLD